MKISKSKMIWICIILIIAFGGVVVFIELGAITGEGIKTMEQAAEVMTEVSYDIIGIGATLEDIAVSLG